MNYVVKEGDSLWSIAITKYGDQAMAFSIADLNGLHDMQRVIPGRVLRLP